MSTTFTLLNIDALNASLAHVKTLVNLQMKNNPKLDLDSARHSIECYANLEQCIKTLDQAQNILTNIDKANKSNNSACSSSSSSVEELN